MTPCLPCFYLFLDFDGILHPGNSGTFRYVAAFESVLDQFPNMKVVFSTSWRLIEPLEELRLNFNEKYASRFVGCTKDLGRKDREILAYVAEHGIRDWIALDDTLSEFPSRPDWLYYVDGAQALSPQNACALVNWMMAKFGQKSI